MQLAAAEQAGLLPKMEESPEPPDLRKAYVWDAVFLLIGVALGIAIILTLLGS